MDLSHEEVQRRRTELERHVWQLLARIDEWNLEKKRHGSILSPRTVLRTLPKMEVPTDLKMRAEYRRKKDKLERVINIQFQSFREILQCARKSMRTTRSNIQKIIEKLENIQATAVRRNVPRTG